ELRQVEDADALGEAGRHGAYGHCGTPYLHLLGLYTFRAPPRPHHCWPSAPDSDQKSTTYQMTAIIACPVAAMAHRFFASCACRAVGRITARHQARHRANLASEGDIWGSGCGKLLSDPGDELLKGGVILPIPVWCSTGGDRPFAIAHKPLYYR